MPPADQPVPRIVIVGAGFTSACAAVQLVRRSHGPLAITLLDPAPQPGCGLAYSATDPDHRLNAPTFVHSMLPDDAGHFGRWCAQQGLAATDPQAVWADGNTYARRSDFGRYIGQTLQAHGQGGPGGATLSVLRDTALGLGPADGAAFGVATGHPVPRLPPPWAAGLASHPAVIANPLAIDRLHRIPSDARLLLLGSGLTALDVLSTLVQRGHAGPIEVVSRHGLRPRPQGPLPAALALALRGDLALLPPGMVLGRLNGPVPAFLAAPGVPPDLRQWLRALRTQIRQAQAAGGHWYTAFDDLRDALWQLWPTLPAAQQRRFVRTLRPWYDVHRYRSAPQNDAIVQAAEAAGRIQFMAARLRSVAAAPGMAGIDVQMAVRGAAAPRTQRFDAVINCTGVDAAAGLVVNPFLAALAQGGWVRRDAAGIGIEVDADCRAIGANGQAQPALRVLGPPSVGSRGDAIGAMFIAAQIHRMLGGALAELGVAGAPSLAIGPS